MSEEYHSYCLKLHVDAQGFVLVLEKSFPVLCNSYRLIIN